jgi:aspartyl-tRNA(Asn)/glutamyl-tRNA(Gln) amidotransferase subunit C
MPIDHATVRTIARLAQLELSRAEVEALTPQLESVLDHVSMLDSLELSPLSPISDDAHPAHALREDIEGASTGQADALRNAPDSNSGLFHLPRSIEE